MMLKNTNCYLVEGYENVVHCQQAPLRPLKQHRNSSVGEI